MGNSAQSQQPITQPPQGGLQKPTAPLPGGTSAPQNAVPPPTPPPNTPSTPIVSGQAGGSLPLTGSDPVNPINSGEDAPSSMGKFMKIGLIAGLILVAVGVIVFIYQDRINNEKSQQQSAQLSSKTTSFSSPPSTSGTICEVYTDLSIALQDADTACRLDLSGQNLTQLPQDITQLSNLTEMLLSNNSFSEFPKELLEITTLLYIDLSNNQISTIPPEIVNLSELNDLNLSNNNITNIPKELSMPNLLLINLMGNNISQEQKDDIEKLLPYTVEVDL